MNFLKTLFWVVAAVVAVIFSMRNWTVVPVNLWSGLELDVKLPLLLLAAFVIGWLPTLALHRTTCWKLRRRLAASERSVAELGAPAPLDEAAPLAERPRLP